MGMRWTAGEDRQRTTQPKGLVPAPRLPALAIAAKGEQRLLTDPTVFGLAMKHPTGPKGPHSPPRAESPCWYRLWPCDRSAEARQTTRRALGRPARSCHDWRSWTPTGWDPGKPPTSPWASSPGRRLAGLNCLPPLSPGNRCVALPHRHGCRRPVPGSGCPVTWRSLHSDWQSPSSNLPTRLRPYCCPSWSTLSPPAPGHRRQPRNGGYHRGETSGRRRFQYSVYHAH